MANRHGAEPWLWWEQDAVSLRSGWLTALAEEYAGCHLPFMGAIGASDRPDAAHLNGVAIYPADACRRVPSLIVGGLLPFDVKGGSRVLSQAHVTPLIQHAWSWNGAYSPPPTFPDAASLSRLSDSAVLFHRCKDASLITQLRCAKNQPTIPSKSSSLFVQALRDVTVVITNFQRADMLWNAFQSCRRAGMDRIVITTSGANPEVKAVHDKIRKTAKSAAILSEDTDSGSNTNWLRGVEATRTDWVQILHDDDLLLPNYGTIRSYLNTADFVCWDGWMHGESHGLSRVFGFDHGVQPVSTLMTAIQSNRLSPSPVAGCFPRKHLLKVLGECQGWGPEFIYRNNLLVGNDLLIWLRAAQQFKTFNYLSTPLTSFGNHSGSATVHANRTKDNRLLEIYNLVRSRFSTAETQANGKLRLPMVTLVGVDTWRPLHTLRALRNANTIVEFADTVLVTMPAAKTHLNGCRILGAINDSARVERERFLLTRLSETFSTPYCIHMEGDAAIRNPSAWDTAWLAYDYIGAPWTYPRKFHGKYPVTAERCVGNLGFSLLSKRLTDALSRCQPPTDAQANISDVYLCLELRDELEKQGLRFAPESMAAQFSCECRPYTNQFGWHGAITAEMNKFVV